MDQWLLELEWLTRGIRAIRIARFGDGKAGEMAMKLKGLRDKAAGFRSALDDVGQAYEEGTDAAKTHATEVRGLKDEFSDMKEDLDFAIGTVGNSSAVTGAGELTGTPKLPPPSPIAGLPITPPLPAQPLSLPLESIDLAPGALNRAKFEETTAPLTSGSAAPSEPVHE